mgnify:CR=1 FL=1
MNMYPADVALFVTLFALSGVRLLLWSLSVYAAI